MPQAWTVGMLIVPDDIQHRSPLLFLNATQSINGTQERRPIKNEQLHPENDTNKNAARQRHPATLRAHRDIQTHQRPPHGRVHRLRYLQNAHPRRWSCSRSQRCFRCCGLVAGSCCWYCGGTCVGAVWGGVQGSYDVGLMVLNRKCWRGEGMDGVF
jgi:hypothetical protein